MTEKSFSHEERRRKSERRHLNGAKFGKSAEELRVELDAVTSLLRRAEEKASDYYDQLLRLKAEFENYRKRIEKEKVR